jgi:hypothetical protein
MVTRRAGGNISGEATTPSGNIFLEAMRGPESASPAALDQWIGCPRAQVRDGRLHIDRRFDRILISRPLYCV